MDSLTQKGVVLGFFKWFIQMKSFHFMTKIYNRHLNVDKYLEAFSGLYDKFVEACMGHHGQVELGSYQLEVGDIDDQNVFSYIDNFRDFLESLKVVYRENLDLLNIRDEMEAETAKLVYLLKLD